jgi:hypothetical protein
MAEARDYHTAKSAAHNAATALSRAERASESAEKKAATLAQQSQKV